MRIRVISFLLFVMVLFPGTIYAQYIDGIYYTLNYTTKEAKVRRIPRNIYDPSSSIPPYEGDITIPSHVTNYGIIYTVTAIDDEAFREYTITSVSIPNSVTSIGYAAFQRCRSLKSITIPSSVTTIGSAAFQECRSLKSITIPSSVTTIGSAAFSYCSSLESITIPSSITTIGASTFQRCENLTSIFFQNGVSAIGDEAFSGCYSLQEVSLPNSLTTIGANAFQYNPVITEIAIPEGVTNISPGTFRGCSNLSTVVLPEQLTDIGEYAFENCYSLHVIDIPKKVATLRGSSFSGCSLATLIIHEGITSIIGAFDHYPRKVIWLCDNPPEGYVNATGMVNYVYNDNYKELTRKTYIYPYLKSAFAEKGIVYVPVNYSDAVCDAIDCEYKESTAVIKLDDTVLHNGKKWKVGNFMPFLCIYNTYAKEIYANGTLDIPNYAFAHCSNIYKVELNNQGNIGEDAFYYAGRDTFGDVTSHFTAIINNSGGISFYAFQDCVSLTSVTIGKNVEWIDYCAFSGCIGLSSITLPGNLQYIGNETFRGCENIKEVYSEYVNPIDIFESTFTNTTYTSGILHVPYNTRSKYKGTRGWKLFENIVEDINVSGVDNIATNRTPQIKTSFQLDGKPLYSLQKGINIIHFSNGTTKKVMSR